MFETIVLINNEKMTMTLIQIQMNFGEYILI